MRLSHSFLFLLILTVVACDVTELFMDDEEKPIPYVIESFAIRAVDNEGLLPEGSDDIEGMIVRDTIYISAPMAILTESIPVTVHIDATEGAVVLPENPIILANNTSLRVLRPDGDKARDYSLVPTIAPASVDASPGPRIRRFELTARDNRDLRETITGAITGDNIVIALPEDIFYAQPDLQPTITLSHPDATYAPTRAQSFSDGVTYTVTKGSETRTYGVIAVVDSDTLSGPRSATDSALINSFSIYTEHNPDVPSLTDINGTIDHRGFISLELPYDVVTNGVLLEPHFTISSGASITPRGAQDFSRGVNYIVVSADGDMLNSYSVVATVDPETIPESVDTGPQANIIEFTLRRHLNPALSRDVSGLVDSIARSVLLPLPSSVIASGPPLEPTVRLSSGAAITPTGARDLISGFTYTVVSADGATQNTWSVNVAVDSDSAVFPSNAEITQFSFSVADNPVLAADISGSVGLSSIGVTVPYEIMADNVALTPTIEVSPNATVVPSGPVTVSDYPAFTVTSQDGSESRIYNINPTIDINTLPEY